MSRDTSYWQDCRDLTTQRYHFLHTLGNDGFGPRAMLGIDCRIPLKESSCSSSVFASLMRFIRRSDPIANMTSTFSALAIAGLMLGHSALCSPQYTRPAFTPPPGFETQAISAQPKTATCKLTDLTRLCSAMLTLSSSGTVLGHPCSRTEQHHDAAHRQNGCWNSDDDNHHYE